MADTATVTVKMDPEMTAMMREVTDRLRKQDARIKKLELRIDELELINRRRDDYDKEMRERAD